MLMRTAPGALAVAICASAATAQDADELAKQLANPVASLISLPFQNNFDFGAGPDDDGFAYTLDVEPVIPFSLTEDWNVISRTILPIAYRDYLPGDPAGIGDITQSLFFSPKVPGPGGLIWGVGPVFLLPTATDDALGTEKWGLGPTAVALVQEGQWTFGALVNHIWSVAGDDERADVNQTFMQPFLTYALGGGVTLSGNFESTYDWTAGQWTVPLNLAISKVTKFGKQPVSLQLGGRVYLDGPDDGPEWGIRTTITFLFPKT
ncbi:transporter [Arvimicrobium flavum]|uniref:transporter n=1 Tax=Arvimicrobium flavum TaxID=3393320 RepID=UPI00398C92CE